MRLIDAEAAIDAVLKFRHSVMSAEEIIETVPPAQPDQNMGEWKDPTQQSAFGFDVLTEKCSCCGMSAVQEIRYPSAKVRIGLEYRRCPYCGALMR